MASSHQPRHNIIIYVSSKNSSNNTQESTYFKIMVIFYKAMRLLFCLDYGFFEFESDNIRLFWKCITVIQGIFMISVYIFTFYFCISSHNIMPNILLIWINLAIHHFLNVILLVFLKPNQTLCSHFSELKKLDKKIGVDAASYSTERNFLVCVVLSFGVRSAIVIISKILTTHLPVILFIIIILLTITLDFVNISCAFVCYSIYCRMRSIIALLMSRNCDYSCLQVIYKSIVDLLEKCIAAFKLLYICALLFDTPAVMQIIYKVVVHVRQGNLSIGVRTEYFTAIMILLFLLAPAIAVDMIATLANEIKVKLHDKLMEEQDKTKIREIERFIRYVEARPCRFRVCKVIPLNADLLGMVLNFCVTYLIVIVQFTN